MLRAASAIILLLMLRSVDSYATNLHYLLPHDPMEDMTVARQQNIDLTSVLLRLPSGDSYERHTSVGWF